MEIRLGTLRHTQHHCGLSGAPCHTNFVRHREEDLAKSECCHFVHTGSPVSRVAVGLSKCPAASSKS
eukprot:90301-Pelagomonas_calceolata.AAC.3